jgi:putative flippase GtrA
MAKKRTKRQQRRKVVIQIIEYMISGGAYFWSGYALFAFLWSGLHWNLFWSTIVSNLFGWTVNYLLQLNWVFKNKQHKSHKTQVTSRYIFITLVDFLLNYLILYALQGIGITPYIGQFVSSGFFTVWNYFWYRFWVFPETFNKRKTVVTPARLVAHRAHGHSGYHRAGVK